MSGERPDPWGFCENILKIDQKIRFAGIYDQTNFYYKIKEGIQSYLNRMDTDLSLSQALSRWQSRKRFKDKIGLPEFSLTKYEKVYRATIPFKDDSILFFSVETDVDIMDIIFKVKKAKDEMSLGSSPNGF